MLLEVIGLVERVYTARTQKERCKYGQQLQKKIRAFLDDFVTHMEQEEAVFQPLLDQNFEPQELQQMNEKVVVTTMSYNYLQVVLCKEEFLLAGLGAAQLLPREDQREELEGRQTKVGR